MNHVLAAEQFGPGDLEPLFASTDYMRQASATLDGREELMRLHGQLFAATMFYEPSTRTRLSFESAAERLGFRCLSTENAKEFSSAAKGETIEDSTRVVGGYADMIIMRHGDNDAAERAAAVSNVPIINGGSGTAEHPTQALLDAYTIHDEKGRLDNLHVVIGGDLKYGRTVKSLARLLAKYPNNHLSFVSKPELQISDDVKQYLEKHGTAYSETDDMYSVLPKADVVYWTRMQMERREHRKPGLFAKLAKIGRALLKAIGIERKPKVEPQLTIGQEALDTMKHDAIVMHPLPRVGEIEKIVDQDPRAAYFRQAENGLYVRMAILHSIAETTIKPRLSVLAA